MPCWTVALVNKVQGQHDKKASTDATRPETTPRQNIKGHTNTHYGATQARYVQHPSSCNGPHGMVMPDASTDTDKDTDPVVMMHHGGNRPLIQHMPGHH